MKRTITMTTILFALMAVFAVTESQGQNAGGGRLAGTWDASVTIYNCATGAPIRVFSSVGSFHQGGTFSGITAGTPPSMRSPEAGIWSHQKEGSYLLRFKAFLFDAAGMPTSYQIVTHVVDLDADNSNYVSDGAVQIFNMAGTQVGAGCSSAVATRMSLD